jgi:protease-4
LELISSTESETEQTQKIIQIDLVGPIVSAPESGSLFAQESSICVEKTKKLIKQAKDDPDVKAVILRIQSPGGEVTASDVIYNQVNELKKTKPVYIFMDGVAASGGYYIACAGSHITASETTITGSIGVIMGGFNASELMGKIGLQNQTFTSGPFKDSLSPARPMSESEKNYIQQLINDMYLRFTKVVSSGRNIPLDDHLRNNIANGKVYLAPTALENHLIDSIGYIEDVYTKVRTEMNIPDLPIYRYYQETNFLEMLAGVNSFNKPIQISLTPNWFNLHQHLNPGVAYYLYTHP